MNEKTTTYIIPNINITTIVNVRYIDETPTKVYSKYTHNVTIILKSFNVQTLVQPLVPSTYLFVVFSTNLIYHQVLQTINLLLLCQSLSIKLRCLVKINLFFHCYGQEKNETTRFPNHMNKGMACSKSRSWNLYIYIYIYIYIYLYITLCVHNVNAKGLYYKNMIIT